MSNLVTLVDSYVVNAIWQVPLVAAAAWVVVRMWRGAERMSVGAQHVAWVSALMLAVVLPAVPVRRLVEMIPQRQAGTATVSIGTDDIDLSTLPPLEMTPRAPKDALQLPRNLVLGVLLGYLAAGLYFALRLMWSLLCTWRLVREGHEQELSAEKRTLWEQCRACFGVERAEWLSSEKIAGPVTMGGGGRPVLLTPEEFAAQCSDEELLAALAHECAHMRRRDFAKNVAYEVASVAIAFHPVTWWVKAQMAETRERVCDGAAGEELMDRQSYVQALLRLAGWVAAAGMAPGVGIFDGKTLERRVLMMKMRRREMSWMKRVMLGVAGAAVMLAAVAVSGWKSVEVWAKTEPVRAAVAAPVLEDGQSFSLPNGDVRALRAPQASARAAATAKVPAPYKKWLDEDVRWTISDTELNAFANLRNDDERDAFEAAFWARRGGDAALDEHYRRIAYANDHFATTSEPGWKTDRGMIYIKYGKPDDVETRPGTDEGHPQTEVWHYKHVDGLGDGIDIEFVNGAISQAPQALVQPKPQGEAAGHVFGTVSDPGGRTVAGARVSVTNMFTAQQSSGVTDGAGRFDVYGLGNEGEKRYYQLKVEAAGYAPQRMNAQMIAAGDVRIDPKLQLDLVSQVKLLTGTLQDPVKISGKAEEGQKISGDEPKYPPIALAAHVQGAVTLHALIGKDGAVEMVNVLSGPEMLRQVATDAAWSWKYKPYVLNGAPVEVETTITMNFTLTGDGLKRETRGQYAKWQDMTRVSGGVMVGQRIAGDEPQYPQIARAAHVQGEVVLHAVISKEGKVAELGVVSGPEMLRQAAEDAVSGWVYKPYMLQGSAVAVETTITVNFTMNGNAAPETPQAAAERYRQLYEQGVVLRERLLSGRRLRQRVTLRPIRRCCLRARGGRRRGMERRCRCSRIPDKPPVMYRIGGEVSAPVVVYTVQPEMTEQAKAEKFAGHVVVSLIVDAQGIPEDVHVIRSAGMGLDEEAVKVVKQYKFKPAMRQGQPVAVALTI